MKRERTTKDYDVIKSKSENNVKLNHNHLRRVAVILLLACAVLIVTTGYFGFRLHIPQKIAARFGWIEKGNYGDIDYSVLAWNNCLNSIEYDCDVVFFGDSITSGCDFNQYFDGVRICNLGLAGDTIFEMKKRVSAIEAVHPEKIFILCGINSLLDNNVDMTVKSYTELLEMIAEKVPEARIYIQSVLPIASYKESTWYGGGICKNNTIRLFNKRLFQLAEEKDIVFINLYEVYEKNNELNPEYTEDGVHIYGQYEPWIEAIKKYIYTD